MAMSSAEVPVRGSSRGGIYTSGSSYESSTKNSDNAEVVQPAAEPEPEANSD